jgi:molybdenum cofactor cytidylyltransferase
MSDEVEGVILAAGLSSRSSPYNKMALPLGDKTVIERSLEGMYDLVSRIIVVVGWQAVVLQNLLTPYAKVECVLNEAYPEGMFGSVKRGVAHVRAPRFFLQPGDIPLVGRAVYQRLLTIHQDVVIPTYAGRRGHPLLLSNSLVPKILAQPPGTTLRDVLAHSSFTLLPVDDEAILWDLDTAQDYEFLLQKHKERGIPEG